jgi:hypothetical protein
LCEGLLRNGWDDVRIVGCGTSARMPYNLAVESLKDHQQRNYDKHYSLHQRAACNRHVMDFRSTVQPALRL